MRSSQIVKYLDNIENVPAHFDCSKNLQIYRFVDYESEIPEGQITVVAYARVSTKHLEQEGSLEAQVNELINYMKSHGWFCILLVVEKASAKNDICREGYQELITAIRQFSPNFLLAKCSDRLNRSVEVNSALLRLCRGSSRDGRSTILKYYMDGIKVDPNSATDIFSSNMLATMNEMVSINQHTKAVDAHLRKCKEHRLSASNNTMGYAFNKETGQMEIVPEEAAIIKRIFEMRVYEDKGSTTIAHELAALGVCGYGSSKFVNENTILKYLRDEAYVGKMYINKRGTDFRLGAGEKSRRYDRPKSEWVACDVPPIVSQELFDLAQELLSQSSKRFRSTHDPMDASTKFAGVHIFASKVLCGDCGSSYIYKACNRDKSVGAYRCSQKKKLKRKETAGKNVSSVAACTNPNSKIWETTLQDITKDALTVNMTNIDEIYDGLFMYIKKVMLENNTKKADRINYQTAIANLEKKKKAILDKIMILTSAPVITQLQKDYEALENEIKALQEQEKEKAVVQEVVNNKLVEINAVKNELLNMRNFDVIDRAIVNRYIDRIVINEDGTVNVFFRFNSTYETAVERQPVSETGIDSIIKGNNPNLDALY